MISNRLFILTIILIFCASGICAQAAEQVTGTQASETQEAATGTQASETQEAAAGTQASEKKKTGRSQVKTYSPGELCCMAKYYYKKTSKDGYYPPEAECAKEEDGTYTITLRERIEDGKDEFHYATYAWYSVKSSGKGEDTVLGTPVDFTKYCKVYTPEQLCRLAQDYYYRTNDFYPPNVSYTANTDGTYTICLYEVIADDGNVEHSATCGWFTVDVCGMGQDDIMLQAVDINP